jgi:hypothetical protein
VALDAIPRQSANCSIKTDHSSSSLDTHSRFNDEDCYHWYDINWTPIEWIWRTEMRQLRLQGTQKFWVKKVMMNQWITHYYRLGGTRCNSQALGQLIYQDRSLSKFTWHPLKVYWRGLLPWERRKLDTDRMNMDDRYETAKIVGIELISEWHGNIWLRNQIIGSINSNTFIIHYIKLFVSIYFTKNEVNYNPLSMIFFGYIILFSYITQKCSEL